MRAYAEEEKIHTTVGDLIVAVSDAAFEFCNDKRVAYFLAGLALKAMLKKAPERTTLH